MAADSGQHTRHGEGSACTRRAALRGLADGAAGSAVVIADGGVDADAVAKSQPRRALALARLAGFAAGASVAALATVEETRLQVDARGAARGERRVRTRAGARGTSLGRPAEIPAGSAVGPAGRCVDASAVALGFGIGATRYAHAAGADQSRGAGFPARSAVGGIGRRVDACASGARVVGPAVRRLRRAPARAPGALHAARAGVPALAAVVRGRLQVDACTVAKVLAIWAFAHARNAHRSAAAYYAASAPALCVCWP